MKQVSFNCNSEATKQEQHSKSQRNGGEFVGGDIPWRLGDKKIVV